MKYLRYLLFLTFIVLSVLLIINNVLDLRYAIEPIEEDSNLLSMKSLVAERLKSNTYIVIVNVGLMIIYSILGLFMMKKPLDPTTNESILDDI